MKQRPLPASGGRPGDSTADRALFSHVLLNGESARKDGSTKELMPSDPESACCCGGYLPPRAKPFFKPGEASPAPRVESRGGVMGLPILDNNCLSYSREESSMSRCARAWLRCARASPPCSLKGKHPYVSVSYCRHPLITSAQLLQCWIQSSRAATWRRHGQMAAMGVAHAMRTQARRTGSEPKDTDI